VSIPHDTVKKIGLDQAPGPAGLGPGDAAALRGRGRARRGAERARRGASGAPGPVRVDRRLRSSL